MRFTRLLTLLALVSTLMGTAFFSTPTYAVTKKSSAPVEDSDGWVKTPSRYGQPGTSGQGIFGNPGVGSSLMNVGVLLGAGFISNNGGTQLNAGLNGDYKFHPNLSGGLYLTYNSLSSPINTTASLWTIAPEANFHFDGQLTGLRVGGKLGLGWTHTSFDGSAATGVGADSGIGLVIGPHVGYDYPLSYGLSIGGEGNILFYTHNEGSNAVNFLGNLKYWF
jgi:hypothetical protein